jgi:excisionase family DNA binding protein
LPPAVEETPKSASPCRSTERDCYDSLIGHSALVLRMRMVTSPFENYLDLVEAARLLNIHPQSLRRLIKQKKMPAVLFAGKYLIERDKLEMFKSNYDPRPGRKPIRHLL